jgi:chromosome segregation ATPase
MQGDVGMNEEEKMTKEEWETRFKQEQKKFESQTELERDLRFQLAQKDAEIKRWQGHYETVNTQISSVHEQLEAVQNRNDVLQTQLDGLKTTNEMQARLLDNYQKHIDLMLQADNNRLAQLANKALPSGEKHE